LSVEDIVQKLQGYKADNAALVQMLATQMEEVRGLPGCLGCSFLCVHRQGGERRGCLAVPFM
jgi:hypothetical protein